MHPNCPICQSAPEYSLIRPKVVCFGFFRRKSDSRVIQRYRCTQCRKAFSRATFHSCYRQNKRHINFRLRALLCSGVSQRRSAQILNISRTTVVRKFLFLGKQSEMELAQMNSDRSPVREMEFDDLETFEHSKCKPISVPLSVESKSRYILGFEVASMPAKGKLVAKAIRKYGPRHDGRALARSALFKKISPVLAPGALIRSDQNPHYPTSVRKYFPKSPHETHKGRRGCIVGQGELKKIGFDPLFSLNHTCAKFRADINRLFRRTWCTTKKIERLKIHIAIYSVFHNQRLPV